MTLQLIGLKSKVHFCKEMARKDKLGKRKIPLLSKEEKNPIKSGDGVVCFMSISKSSKIQ